MSANCPDEVPSNRTDDDQLAIDINDTSWVWSSSSPSWSLSLTTSSATDSWRLSDDPSNDWHRDGSDDCTAVSDNRVADSVTLDADADIDADVDADAVADADADGSEDTFGSTFAFVIDVDWSHGDNDDDSDDSGRTDDWQRHPQREEYDGSCAIAAAVTDRVYGMTGAGHSRCAVGPMFDVEGCGCGVGDVERSDGDGDDAAEDDVFSYEALFNDTMIRQRTPPFNS